MLDASAGDGFRRDFFRRLYYGMSALAIDPRRLAASWRALPHYIRNGLAYVRGRKGSGLPLRAVDLQFATADRFRPAGMLRDHYFHQDLWAASRLYQRGVRFHTDVGSRLDGFVAHVLPFCRVTYVDLRPLDVQVPGLIMRQGSITSLPFEDRSIESLSCLHVLEHIGLGRYGDEVDPLGHERAASELVRVLKEGAELLLGTPVGRERLCFDAHRIFDPETIVSLFDPLILRGFHLIDDASKGIQHDARFDDARRCVYGCGLFVFEQPVSSE